MRIVSVICAMLVAATMWADDATWPTYGELTKSAKTGDYLAYQVTAKRNGTTDNSTMWHTWSEIDGALRLSVVVYKGEVTPLREPTAETSAKVMRMAVPIKPEDPFQKAAAPQGATVKSETITAAAFTKLSTSGGLWDGTLYTQTLSLTLPNEMALHIVTRMWVSPEAPATGVVKLEQAVTGPMTMTSSMELAWSSTHKEKPVEAPKAEEPQGPQTPVEVVVDGQKLMDYSQTMARQFWQADAAWKSPLGGVDSDIDSFRARWVMVLLDRSKLDAAIEAEAKLTGLSPMRQELRKRLIRDVALEGRRTEIITRWGVQERNVERDAINAKVRYMAENPMFYEFSFLLQTITAIADPTHQRSAVYVALAAREKTATLEQKKALLALMPDDAERLKYAKSILWSMLQYTPDLARFEELCVLVPALTQEPDFQDQRLKLLANAGQVETLKGELDAYLARPNLDPTVAYLILKTCNDPRAATMRTAALKRTFEVKAERVAAAAKNRYLRDENVVDLAAAAAELGDRETAIKAITIYIKEPISRHWIAPIVALYGEGGQPEAALAWRESFPLGPKEQAADQPFWRMAALAEIDAGIAEWEFSQGNQAAYERFMKQAIEGALAANKALIAYNAGQSSRDRVWWHRANAVDAASPYGAVVATLLRLEQYQPVIRVLREVQDEMPATAASRKVWEASTKTLAEQENWPFFTAVTSLVPTTWETNWHTAVFRDNAKILADAKQVEALRALAEAIESPHGRAEVQRAAVIGLANQGDVENAAAFYAELQATVEAGASVAHQAYASVALARAQLNAGLRDEALATWQSRGTTTLSEGMVRRGFNGHDWRNYMMELGKDIVVAGMSPVDRVKWFDACSNDLERAYLALGMARIR